MPEGVFLYYLPGKSKDSLTADDLARNPILSGPFFEHIHSPRLLKTRIMGCNVHGGPDNGDGCVIAPEPQVPIDMLPGYFKDRQTWKKFGDQWIGWQTDRRPGPESLRRANQIDGYEVELGDGLIWQAPIVRPFHEASKNWGCNLPMVIGLDESNEPTARVIERFRWAWDITGRVADILFNGVPANLFAMFDDAASCLSINYRIGRHEASILELFNSQTISDVLKSAVDDPMVDAVLKAEQQKNPTSRPDSANTSDGSQG